MPGMLTVHAVANPFAGIELGSLKFVSGYLHTANPAMARPVQGMVLSGHGMNLFVIRGASGDNPEQAANGSGRRHRERAPERHP